jgi:hypothetical protein
MWCAQEKNARLNVKQALKDRIIVKAICAESLDVLNRELHIKYVT